ncbi:bifunctional diguanylate cyclase/phosphodiesterase [Psychromonas aquimarina]|uniref:bifunctional diguanylate cyclase/phosphodiesterase n=1 Tax=Psychromonas aquimarina TaxID=444919 RepID=UPI0012F9425C|nr:EAL domain-containing protein [Psychromonas aquimarina]
MESPPIFSFKWYDSLQFKISAIFIVLFLIITISVIMVLKTIGNELIREQAYLRLSEADHEVAAELEKRITLAATLADAMANLAEKLPRDVDLHKALLLQLMNYKGTEEYIAGGGVWPAPFQFDTDIERRSFFWGRNQSGRLEFYDDYNQQDGNGYHHEEWYVPAAYLAEGGVYWSKSYTDPYSLQPMVTVSVPMINDGQNIGAATIDLKFEGLHQLLEKVTQSFDGYAFAVDRNGTFLSYPDIQQVISTVNNRDGSELKSFLSYQDLAEKSPQFSEFAGVLDEKRSHLLKSIDTKSRLRNELANKLASASYQINLEEANIIAASMLSSILDTDSRIFKHNNFLLEKDPLLNEPVFVSVSMMPDTFWKIVTVMPYSKGVEKIAAAYDRLKQATVSVVLLAIFIIWLLIRQIVTVPVRQLSRQIQSQQDNKASELHLLDTSAKGELGALAQLFNQRTGQLLYTHNKIKKLAHFDVLTGLPNRRLLINRLDEKLEVCKRQTSYGALLFIDLDNFKVINDSLGHDMGDELLVRVAERFQKCVRGEDTVARLGGDEFVVLIMKNSDYSEQLNHESTVVARKLVRAMEKPFKLRTHQHHVTISIGISSFSRRSTSSDELLRQADTAMYRAKAKGKNGFCFFKPKMQEQADLRLEVEEALRTALAHKQLFLMYQSQVDSQGICIGAEALIRWSHPQKGMLPPAEFIAIAEDSGLIIPLGTWVIDEACRQLKSWNDQKIKLEKISVNVSPKQFRHSNFIESVRGSIEKHQISASQLTLEITEGIVIDDIADTIDKMSILKSLGVRISIDDFGTGYSSLTYLKMLPLDQLKIDQSFVRDITSEPNDAMIVETIIAIASHFDLNVIAEGVENKDQIDFLADKGCTQFQGYYFGKPMLAADFSAYMTQQPVSNVSHICRRSSSMMKK